VAHCVSDEKRGCARPSWEVQHPIEAHSSHVERCGLCLAQGISVERRGSAAVPNGRCTLLRVKASLLRGVAFVWFPASLFERCGCAKVLVGRFTLLKPTASLLGGVALVWLTASLLRGVAVQQSLMGVRVWALFWLTASLWTGVAVQQSLLGGALC